MTKGQTELVTAVLLGGVVVSLVVAGMSWAPPIIEKRSSSVEAKTNTALLLSIYEKIRTMSEACSGVCSETVELTPKGIFSVSLFESRYNIFFETSVARSVYADGRLIPLNTGNTQVSVSYGETPGVLYVLSQSKDKAYTATYRLGFREVYTPKKCYRIDLEPGIVTSATGGRIKISFRERTTSPGACAYNGKDLEITKIKVEFV